MEITENVKQWVGILLGKQESSEYDSCLVLALRSAQFNLACLSEESVVNRIERCLEGYTAREISSFSLLNAVTQYMIALDIMGCCFERTGSEPSAKNEIVRVLKDFSDLSEEECVALKNLRNTLAHNFGLATEKKKERFRFHLDAKNPELITLPQHKWGDGYQYMFDDTRLGTETTIGVEKLSELVCCVYSQIVEAYNNDTLSLRVGSVNELKSRFILRIS